MFAWDDIVHALCMTASFDNPEFTCKVLSQVVRLLPEVLKNLDDSVSAGLSRNSAIQAGC